MAAIFQAYNDRTSGTLKTSRYSSRRATILATTTFIVLISPCSRTAIGRSASEPSAGNKVPDFTFDLSPLSSTFPCWQHHHISSRSPPLPLRGSRGLDQCERSLHMTIITSGSSVQGTQCFPRPPEIAFRVGRSVSSKSSPTDLVRRLSRAPRMFAQSNCHLR